MAFPQHVSPRKDRPLQEAPRAITTIIIIIIPIFLKEPRPWPSGRTLALYAVGQGSIPDRVTLKT